MENEINFVKLHQSNLREYFDRLDGNIYFKNMETGLFEVADGFTFGELQYAYNNCMLKLVWIQGPSLGTDIKLNY
jgi:hypothetical protein